jgi:hypothetical protein
VLLDGLLQSGEPPSAVLALAPPPNRIALLRLSGVQDSVFA